MISDVFQGDPRLILDENGARLQFIGGHPLLDQGLENLALISLFTAPGWAGNDLFADAAQQIGSDFESSAKQPITLSALNDIRNAAIKALENPAFGKVTVDVTNPTGIRIQVSIRIEPPGADMQELLLTTNGLNWQAQAANPAYELIK